MVHIKAINKRSCVASAEMCSGSEAGSYLRRKDFCVKDFCITRRIESDKEEKKKSESLPLTR